MSGFKLLAIRPLEGCDIRFTRILNHGEIYKFYSEYNFLLSNPKDIHSEVVGIEVSDETSLFNLNDLPVNISAVVGKNGSGKSSRSEEHTSELQSRPHLVCRLLLEKKKKKKRSR